MIPMPTFSHPSYNSTMGSCISKCRPYPSPLKDPPPLPQDKLVISQSPVTSNNPLYDLSIVKPPIPASPLSSSSPSMSTSLSSSKTNSYFCSSASSSSKETAFSNEFLLSCAQKNPHIMVPHPQKQTSYAMKEPTKVHVSRLRSPSKQEKISPKQFSTGTNQSLPVKRARSNSPTTFARQKSLRSGLSATCSVPPPYRSMASPTGSRRRNMVALPPAARKDKLRTPSPCRQSSTQHLSREKEVSLHWVNPKDDANRRREVTFDQPLIEDVNNPLISMDCFIFL